MSRIRNPRYAPESLERRLSPSSFGIAPVADVQYSNHINTLMSQTETPRPTDSNGDPLPPPVSGGGPGQSIPT